MVGVGSKISHIQDLTSSCKDMKAFGYELLCKEVTDAARGAAEYENVLRHFVGHKMSLGGTGFI